MRTKRVPFAAMAGFAAGGMLLAGGTLIAGAQEESGEKNAPAVGQGDAKKPGGAAKKPDTAEQQKLRAELDALLRQRASLNRRIEETRNKLGESDGAGGMHRKFEFRNGNGQPQVFEFKGDGTGSLPPEARKQIEEAQKRLKDVFGNMQFENFPSFDFKFDGANGPDGAPEMKEFRERMQKWGKEFRERMQQRHNDGAPGKAPGKKSQDAKPDKPANNKLKTFDA